VPLDPPSPKLPYEGERELGSGTAPGAEEGQIGRVPCSAADRLFGRTSVACAVCAISAKTVAIAGPG
jgi:hypothetical protein